MSNFKVYIPITLNCIINVEHDATIDQIIKSSHADIDNIRTEIIEKATKKFHVLVDTYYKENANEPFDKIEINDDKQILIEPEKKDLL